MALHTCAVCHKLHVASTDDDVPVHRLGSCTVSASETCDHPVGLVQQDCQAPVSAAAVVSCWWLTASLQSEALIWTAAWVLLKLKQSCSSPAWHDCSAPEGCFVSRAMLVFGQTEADPEAVQAGYGWRTGTVAQWL